MLTELHWQALFRGLELDFIMVPPAKLPTLFETDLTPVNSIRKKRVPSTHFGVARRSARDSSCNEVDCRKLLMTSDTGQFWSQLDPELQSRVEEQQARLPVTNCCLLNGIWFGIHFQFETLPAVKYPACAPSWYTYTSPAPIPPIYRASPQFLSEQASSAGPEEHIRQWKISSGSLRFQKLGSYSKQAQATLANSHLDRENINVLTQLRPLSKGPGTLQ